MADGLTARERGLRKLSLPYSLALRLRDAGTAPDVVCEYVDIDQGDLAGLYQIAEAKLAAAQEETQDEPAEARCNTVEFP